MIKTYNLWRNMCEFTIFTCQSACTYPSIPSTYPCPWRPCSHVTRWNKIRTQQCWQHIWAVYPHIECWPSNADQIHTTTTTQLSQYTLSIERSGKSDEWMDLVEVFSQAEWISGRLELFWAFLPLGWGGEADLGRAETRLKSHKRQLPQPIL